MCTQACFVDCHKHEICRDVSEQLVCCTECQDLVKPVADILGLMCKHPPICTKHANTCNLCHACRQPPFFFWGSPTTPHRRGGHERKPKHSRHTASSRQPAGLFWQILAGHDVRSAGGASCHCKAKPTAFHSQYLHHTLMALVTPHLPRIHSMGNLLVCSLVHIRIVEFNGKTSWGTLWKDSMGSEKHLVTYKVPAVCLDSVLPWH